MSPTLNNTILAVLGTLPVLTWIAGHWEGYRTGRQNGYRAGRADALTEFAPRDGGPSRPTPDPFPAPDLPGPDDLGPADPEDDRADGPDFSDDAADLAEYYRATKGGPR